MTAKLEPLIAEPGFTGNAPGGPSRWSTERSAQWCPLKPKLVVEIGYDHFSGDRFRHGTSILRWRPDKAPRQCTFDQLGKKPSIRKSCWLDLIMQASVPLAASTWPARYSEPVIRMRGGTS